MERVTPASARSSALTLVLRTPLQPPKIPLGPGKPPKGEGQPYPSPQTWAAMTASKPAPPWEGQADRLEASSPLALRLLFSDLNSLRFNPHRQVRIKFKTGFPGAPSGLSQPPQAGRPLPGSSAPPARRRLCSICFHFPSPPEMGSFHLFAALSPSPPPPRFPSTFPPSLSWSLFVGENTPTHNSCWPRPALEAEAEPSWPAARRPRPAPTPGGYRDPRAPGARPLRPAGANPLGPVNLAPSTPRPARPPAPCPAARQQTGLFPAPPTGLASQPGEWLEGEGPGARGAPCLEPPWPWRLVT